MLRRLQQRSGMPLMVLGLGVNEELTSRNWTSPISPKALTTSLPISFAMYSCVRDMSLDRNNVSLGTAMMGKLA